MLLAVNYFAGITIFVLSSVKILHVRNHPCLYKFLSVVAMRMRGSDLWLWKPTSAFLHQTQCPWWGLTAHRLLPVRDRAYWENKCRPSLGPCWAPQPVTLTQGLQIRMLNIYLQFQDTSYQVLPSPCPAQGSDLPHSGKAPTPFLTIAFGFLQKISCTSNPDLVSASRKPCTNALCMYVLLKCVLKKHIIFNPIQ